MKPNVFLSKSIFTGLGSAPFDGAVVVRGSRIIGVGPREMASLFPDAEVRDFGDCTVMPAFHDAHLHLILGAMCEKGGFLREDASEDAAAKHLFDLNPEGDNSEWLLGGGWDHFRWPENRLPSRKSLDRYFPKRRVFLMNKECHGAWANSLTLSHFGIGKDTPDPEHGCIFRDEDGLPTGYLHETAANMVLKKILAELPPESFESYVGSFAQKAWSFGITSVTDMQISDISSWDIFTAADRNAALGVRVHCSVPLVWETSRLLELAADDRGDRLRFSGTKDFVDGTPMGYTGYMIEPYSDRPDFCGSPALDLDFLREKVCECDRSGIRVRLHCCGDNAVRAALDSFEFAKEQNGGKRPRHSIEHIEAIAPSDIPRFGQLGIIASVQPDHLPKYDFENHPFWYQLGKERMRWSWPFKSLMNAGGRLAFGSDYCVSELNPMRGLYRAVTRLTDDGEPKGGFSPEEKLTLADALMAYTAGSAYCNGREDDLGTLEAGKIADIAVLDRDIFAIPPEELIDVKVSRTYMDGDAVFVR